MIFKLRNVRLAFANLYEAKQVNGEGTPAFSGSFLIKKDDPQLKEIEAAIAAVAKEKWGNKSATILKELLAKDRTFLHDGDLKADYDGFPGNVFVSSRTTEAPKILGDGKPYSGCYVHASFDLWAQDNQYGKRINAKLRAVRFAADGEAFSGSSPVADDELGDLSDTGDDILGGD